MDRQRSKNQASTFINIFKISKQSTNRLLDIFMDSAGYELPILEHRRV